MELDELKSSWKIIDRKLQDTQLTDEKKLAELIATHRGNTHRSLGAFQYMQRWSLWLGVSAILLIAVGIYLAPAYISQEKTLFKAQFLGVFSILSLAAACFGDIHTYRMLKNIHIEKMSIVEVSQRIVKLRRWMQWECVIICLWAIVFTGIYYWIMDFYTASLQVQICLIAFLTLGDTFILYFYYKKFIYKHLNYIKKNVEELKDLCTE